MTRFPATLLACLAALAPALPASAQEAPALTFEQRMKLRCSAAFAIVARQQAAGVAEALRYPPLAERGREYFVRSAAQVMEAGKLDRPAIDAALTREARELAGEGALAAIMPVCLRALDESGL